MDRFFSAKPPKRGTQHIVTNEMRTATISVCVALIDARNGLDKILERRLSNRAR